MSEPKPSYNPQDLDCCPSCRAAWLKSRNYQSCPFCGFDDYFVTPTKEELEVEWVYSPHTPTPSPSA